MCALLEILMPLVSNLARGLPLHQTQMDHGVRAGSPPAFGPIDPLRGHLSITSNAEAAQRGKTGGQPHPVPGRGLLGSLTHIPPVSTPFA